MSIPDPPGVGERIAQARRELAVRLWRDVAQSDVAKALGMHPSAVSQWEAGQKTPRGVTAERLATVLGVSPGYLLFGQPPKQVPLRPDVLAAWDGAAPFPPDVTPAMRVEEPPPNVSSPGAGTHRSTPRERALAAGAKQVPAGTAKRLTSSELEAERKRKGKRGGKRAG